MRKEPPLPCGYCFIKDYNLQCPEHGLPMCECGHSKDDHCPCPQNENCFCMEDCDCDEYKEVK